MKKINNTIISETIYKDLTEKKQKSFQYESQWFFVKDLKQNNGTLLVRTNMMIPHLNRIDEDKYYDFIIKNNTK